MVRARLGEVLFGVFLLGLGLFAIYKASALPFGSVTEPGAGLFPVSIAVLLALFALVSLGSRQPPDDSAAAERSGIARVVVMIVGVAVYAWLLPRAGFLLCTVALLVLMLRGLGGVRWTGTVVSALVGATACYVLFTRLGLPLPAGLLGF